MTGEGLDDDDEADDDLFTEDLGYSSQCMFLFGHLLVAYAVTE